jgi:hypothetical protein
MESARIHEVLLGMPEDYFCGNGLLQSILLID